MGVTFEVFQASGTLACLKDKFRSAVIAGDMDLADIFSDIKLWQVNKTNSKFQALPLHIHPGYNRLVHTLTILVG